MLGTMNGEKLHTASRARPAIHKVRFRIPEGTSNIRKSERSTHFLEVYLRGVLSTETDLRGMVDLFSDIRVSVWRVEETKSPLYDVSSI